MLVSVILPLYNGEKWIMDAIQSVLGQEYTSIELCVVDDGSSDNSISIVKQVVTQDQRVKFIHNTKRGIASARNTGINRASGDIITFIDQDDLWTKNKLTKQIPELLKNPNAIILGNLEQFCDEPILPSWAKKEHINQAKPGWEPGTLMLKKKIIKQFNGFDESLQHGGDDSDFFMRVRDAGVSCIMLDEVILKKRIHQNNTSSLANHQSDLLKNIRASLQRQDMV